MTKSESPPASANGVDAREVRLCLDKILASPSFANSPRMQQFLQFIVEETLQGRTDAIKETVIASCVFNRKSDFDPRNDSVVRVEASHVRKRLREYYLGEGRKDSLVLELRPGGYVPVFRPEAGHRNKSAKTGRKPLAAILVVGVFAIAMGYWGFRRFMIAQDPASVAVLPFTDLDGAPDTGYFADGLTEDLTTSLGQSTGLSVVARSSAFQFRGKQLDARSIGRQLGVDALVEGSVRRNNGNVKITAELIDVKNGYSLWSDDFEGATNEVPVFQEQIAAAVRKTLRTSEPLAHATAASASHIAIPSALDAYWRGRYLQSRIESRAASVSFFEEAIRLDPEFAPAYAALTSTYSTLAFHMEGPIDELIAKAQEAGKRALELDPTSSEAYASLAVLSYSYRHDWPAAQREFERALELNPSNARAHVQYALGLTTRGRFDAAIAHIQQGRKLDPLAYAIGNDLATALYCAGRYDESLEASRRNLEADPNFQYAHVIRGSAYAMKLDLPDALAEYNKAVQSLGREPWILGRMGYTLGRAGRKTEAESIVKEIEATQGPAIEIAFILVGLGENQQALDALDRSYAGREVDLNFMAVDPMLANLRNEPRFVILKSRLGL